MDNNGKVSVIMGIYNCEKTLPAAIESIVNQTYTNWELIMCDDASTDHTYAVAEEYSKKYPNKIILLKNASNRRLAYSLNHCLEVATGLYVARMDGDDLCVKTRFAEQVEFLCAHKEYDLVGTWMKRFNDDGFADEVKPIEKPDKFAMRRGNPFCHATIMTYKSVFENVGGYTVAERTKRAQDYDLWFKFFHHGYNGYNIQKSLYYVREDKQAIRRRTFKVRWNAYKTTRIGYKLLGFPKVWLMEAFVRMIIKSLTPYRFIDAYRKQQSKG